MLLILLGTTGLVLLIVRANVANLTLARLLRRDREFAVRTALGAGRSRLVRQLLTESTLLSLAGGIVGLWFAAWTTGLLTTFVARFTPRTGEIAIDARVLLFAVLVSMITGVAFGILPALASRVDLAGAMKQGSKGAGESAGRRRPAGQPHRRAGGNFRGAARRRGPVADQLLPSCRASIPGTTPTASCRPSCLRTSRSIPTSTRNAASTCRSSIGCSRNRASVAVAVTNAGAAARQPAGERAVFRSRAGPRTTRNAGRRPTRASSAATSSRRLACRSSPGGSFTESDAESTPLVVVINRAMTRYWDRTDAIGLAPLARRRSELGDDRRCRRGREAVRPDREAVAQAHTPLRQTTVGLGGLVLMRTNGDEVVVRRRPFGKRRAADRSQHAGHRTSGRSMRSAIAISPRPKLTAAAAHALRDPGAAGHDGWRHRRHRDVGVPARTQEFGVRMALGASRATVLQMVIRQGLRLVGAGLLVGVIAALAATRVLSAYLFDTRPTDPLTLFLVGGGVHRRRHRGLRRTGLASDDGGSDAGRCGSE